MTKLLEGRSAIIYGGGGAIGGGVARTFAREGAQVFLVGRTREALDQVAGEITSPVALPRSRCLTCSTNRRWMRTCATWSIAPAGSTCRSISSAAAMSQGVPLVEMSTDDLMRAVDTGLRSSFISARAAGRQMIQQGSGVILHLNSASGAGAMPGMGSTGPADAATEAFMRYLAAEVGPSGVRVCGIWTAAVTGTLTREKLAAVGGENVPDPEMVEQMIAGIAALRRAPRLDDVAEAAAFLASDRAGGVTGSMTNVTSGLVLR